MDAQARLALGLEVGVSPLGLWGLDFQKNNSGHFPGWAGASCGWDSLGRWHT